MNPELLKKGSWVIDTSGRRSNQDCAQFLRLEDAGGIDRYYFHFPGKETASNDGLYVYSRRGVQLYLTPIKAPEWALGLPMLLSDEEISACLPGRQSNWTDEEMHRHMARFIERAVTRKIERFIRDDAQAISHQTLGQYRTAIIKMLRGEQ